MQNLLPNFSFYIGRSPIQTSSSHISVRHKYFSDSVTIPCATPSHVYSALELGSLAELEMAKLPSYHKRKVLLHFRDLLAQNRDHLAKVIVCENGKTIKDARGEVDRALFSLGACAEEVIKDFDVGKYGMGDVLPGMDGTRVFQTRYPIGLTSCIVPFNFPVNLAIHKIGPAIAVGNPFILKPSDLTPLSALVIGNLLSQLDLPVGAFSVLPTDADATPLLSTDERVKMISFTGSDRVGWMIKSQSGSKKLTLELGGDAANIVDASADINLAATRLAWAGFYLSGQSCISAQRIYVHEDIYDEFIRIFIEKVEKLVIGDPFDESVDIGPMISEDSAKRAASWIRDAESHGAKILTGTNQNDGTFLKPTVLTNVSAQCTLAKEEIFAPVCYVEKFNSIHDVCTKVNNSKYGLQAGLFTQDLKNIFYAYDNIKVGGLIINDVSATRIDTVPYGGIKNSGAGREGIRAAMEEMTELRVLLLKGN